ncbi:hypothetical protein BJ170DRAFT_30908 [Xylariales sp. AK1849]|nr:hypothetical protein BJ170DRAFT_30908 [Xylariales sp. AK1849]
MSASIERVIELGVALGGVALSPFVSGFLLAILGDFSQPVREALIRYLPLPPTTTLRGYKKGIRVLFVLAVVRLVGNALSNWALNNWRLSPQRVCDWKREIAVVTGGSSGIGQKLVEGLVRKGTRVAVLDVQPLPTSMQDNANIRYFECDVTSATSVAKAADAVRGDLGHPTILINNAGIARPTPILKTSDANLRKTFEVNTISHWTTTKEFVPHMIEVNEGHVVTIASLASFVALPTGADYSASKASALAFHEALRCELKHLYKAPGVMTTIIHPNFVQTPLIEDIADRLKEFGTKLLTSDDVANQVLTQVFSRKGGQVIIPSGASFLSGLRGWPMWIQELVRDGVGRGAGKTVV